MYAAIAGGERHVFDSLAKLMAHATPARSGDKLAGLAAPTAEARVAAQFALAEMLSTGEAGVPQDRRKALAWAPKTRR